MTSILQIYVFIVFSSIIISFSASIVGIECKFRRLYAFCLVKLSRLIFPGNRSPLADEALEALIRGISNNTPSLDSTEIPSLSNLTPQTNSKHPKSRRTRHLSSVSNSFCENGSASFSEMENSKSDGKIPRKNDYLALFAKDILHELNNGISAIIDDNVTKRFVAEDLANWNLLKRTGDLNGKSGENNHKILVFYAIGFVFRYLFLVPIRLFLTVLALFSMFVCANLLKFGIIPSDRVMKTNLNLFISRLINRALGTIINFHNPQNQPKNGGICVANHTTVLDIFVMMSDRTFSIIGQQHPGLIGWFQNTINMFMNNIWFDRGDENDRSAVSQAMIDHVNNETGLDPILIFPEGTCINNTSVMMFKKGSFEIDTVFHPVAIKYNPYFGDAFWNSSKYSMPHYLIQIFSSWCIVADVYYLPPVRKGAGESSLEFANRTKKDIALCGGLLDLAWDGGLKRSMVKSSDKEKGKKRFSQKARLRKIVSENVVDDEKETDY